MSKVLKTGVNIINTALTVASTFVPALKPVAVLTSVASVAVEAVRQFAKGNVSAGLKAIGVAAVQAIVPIATKPLRFLSQTVHQVAAKVIDAGFGIYAAGNGIIKAAKEKRLSLNNALTIASSAWSAGVSAHAAIRAALPVPPPKIPPTSNNPTPAQPSPTSNTLTTSLLPVSHGPCIGGCGGTSYCKYGNWQLTNSGWI